MHNRLQRIPAGQGRGWQMYEQFTSLLFRNLFWPIHIAKPKVQSTSPNPDHRRDIIIPVTADTGFWHTLVFLHSGDLFVVDCKNYEGNVQASDVETVAKYLRRPAVASLGFLVSRLGPNGPAMDAAIDIYRTDRRLIIFLDDDDLHELINCVGDAAAATAVLRRIYQDQKAAM